MTLPTAHNNQHPANHKTTIHYESLFSETLIQIKNYIRFCLTPVQQTKTDPAYRLWEAMRYASLDGGKHIRSVLTVETCLAFGGDIASALPTACAIELVHTQSLIHDDLPCMDNDDLRRGKPTVHKAFGESTAVLAGDALLAMAFGIITQHTPALLVPADNRLAVIQDLSNVASIDGLVNGQFVDIAYESKPFTPDILDYIHLNKTAALFRFTTRAGAHLASASTTDIDIMTHFGRNLGLAFQIVDDILDIQASSETLGKTVGKDIEQQKATYPALYGIEASRQKAITLIEEAKTALSEVSCQQERLMALADYILHRIY